MERKNIFIGYENTQKIGQFLYCVPNLSSGYFSIKLSKLIRNDYNLIFYVKVVINPKNYSVYIFNYHINNNKESFSLYRTFFQKGCFTSTKFYKDTPNPITYVTT